MKFGIILESNNPETCWNAIRFGNTALANHNEVQIFLMGAGVEIENISSDKFNTKKLIEDFLNNNGRILACGTCLKSRSQNATQTCPISTMMDCVKMVEWADKVITF